MSVSDSKRVLVESGDDGVEVIVEQPPTASNYLEYNRLCTQLDDRYLMQPINEAEYDSETQACVDKRDNGPESFYDHYVHRPTKKNGLAVGCEAPMSSLRVDDERLVAPVDKDLPIGPVDRTILRDPVARRLATGRLPPGAN